MVVVKRTCWAFVEGVEVVDGEVSEAAVAGSGFRTCARGTGMGPGVLIMGRIIAASDDDRRLRFLKTTQQQATSIRTTINVAMTPAAARTPPDRPPALPPTFCCCCCCCGTWFPLE